MAHINSTKLEMLSKDNYDSWKIHAQALLIKMDGWDYVSGAIPKPASVEGDGAAARNLEIALKD